MYEIPLFPLNTVLFPGAPIHLHIFESRYRRMIQACLQEGRPFGVVLIRRGAEAYGPLAEPYEVGCSARIVQVQPLEGGRMNLVAFGEERFRILTLDASHHPYYVAQVQPYPCQVSPSPPLEEQVYRLRQHMTHFIGQLLRASGESPDYNALPQDALSLAYMAAALLQIEPRQKQALLEMATLGELLVALLRLYSRERALLPALLHNREIPNAGPFSRN